MSDVDAVPLTIADLVRYITIFPENPPRTLDLEKAISIGTGFHGKWYASQREHWLGFLGFRIRQEALRGRDFAGAPASKQWNATHCFPMLFWLAECAGTEASTLSDAEQVAHEAAAEIGHDHPSHGKAARSVLPWVLIDSLLRQNGILGRTDESVAAMSAAYLRLATARPAYRVDEAAERA